MHCASGSPQLLLGNRMLLHRLLELVSYLPLVLSRGVQRACEPALRLLRPLRFRGPILLFALILRLQSLCRGLA